MDINLPDVVAEVASMTTAGDQLFVHGVLAKAQAQLVTRNAKAFAQKVNAEAVRMPSVPGASKRKREEASTADELRQVSRATSGMIKAAGEMLLADGTEDACHMVTDRWSRCKYGGVYVVEAIRDPEEPDYDFVYCKKHEKALQSARELATQQARVERCLASARGVEEVAVPANPVMGGGAAASVDEVARGLADMDLVE